MQGPHAGGPSSPGTDVSNTTVAVNDVPNIAANQCRSAPFARPMATGGEVASPGMKTLRAAPKVPTGGTGRSAPLELSVWRNASSVLDDSQIQLSPDNRASSRTSSTDAEDGAKVPEQRAPGVKTDQCHQCKATSDRGGVSAAQHPQQVAILVLKASTTSRHS